MKTLKKPWVFTGSLTLTDGQKRLIEATDKASQESMETGRPINEILSRLGFKPLPQTWRD